MRAMMRVMDQGDVTALLLEASAGGAGAQERLAEVVYDDLRRLARFVRGEAAGAAPVSQEATALVHEAWLRLVARGDKHFESRGHFFCVAARAMRGLVVDSARASGRRRAEGDTRLALEPSPDDTDADAIDVLDLDSALEDLHERDSDLARLVELRFFAGLSVKDAAESLSLSLSGAERRWRLARAWLHRRLAEQGGA